MMCYPLTGCIMFSLKKLKFYADRGPDNPNTQFEQWNAKGEKRIYVWKVNRSLGLQMHTYSDNNKKKIQACTYIMKFEAEKPINPI